MTTRPNLEAPGISRGEPHWDTQRPYGDFAPGRWAWLIGRVKRVPRAIPCAGHQQLWDVARAGGDVLTRITDLVERAGAA